MSTQNLCMNVSSSTIHNHQNVKIAWISINGWVDKEDVVYPYNRVLYSSKKEQCTDTYYNTDKPWKHYAKRKSQSQKTTYCIIPFIGRIQKRPGAGGSREWRVTADRYRASFLGWWKYSEIR